MGISRLAVLKLIELVRYFDGAKKKLRKLIINVIIRLIESIYNLYTKKVTLLNDSLRFQLNHYHRAFENNLN